MTPSPGCLASLSLPAFDTSCPSDHSNLCYRSYGSHRSYRSHAARPSLRITPALRRLLAMALREDVGPGDATSIATIPRHLPGTGRIFAKQAGVLCGLDVAREVFRLTDARIRVTAVARDGAVLSPGDDIARVTGPLRSILTGERLALNFLQQLSGVATLTRRYVDALRAAGSRIDVVDTRKTTPLWRELERHAVRVGGGRNHRFALYDMYLIKNNHADAAGGVGEALRRVARHNARRRKPLPVAVEARDLDEVRTILEYGADLVMLDNMAPEEVGEAVRLIGRRAKTEITGGVTLERLERLAGLVVDRVSVGALTHSAPALDIALHVTGKSTPGSEKPAR